MGLEQEIRALEAQKAAIELRLESLRTARKTQYNGPQIRAVLVRCPKDGKSVVVPVEMGLDGRAKCEKCGLEIMAGWGADGILSAYLPSK